MLGAMSLDTRHAPDPVRGRPASAQYAEHYAATHRAPMDLAYRCGYVDLLVLDQLLADYRLLDVGCGTGGYLRLAKHAAEITALDFSDAMIAKARELRAELGLERVNYVRARFEDFEPPAQFDAIRLTGAFGWYQPWPGSAAVLDKARRLLRPGGLLVASHVPPRTPLHHLKSTLAPRRTVVISDAAFHRLTTAAGFAMLFSLMAAASRIVFLRASSVDPAQKK